MVNREYITEAIDKSIITIQKCWTTARMHEKLATYTHDEKVELLQGRLTPVEWEEYNSIVKEYDDDIKDWEDIVKNKEIPEENIPKIKEIYQELRSMRDEELFQYERRIIEDYHVPTDLEIPVIDESKYVHDESVPITSEYENDYGRQRINPIEAEQIRLQESNVYFTEKENDWLTGYFLSDYKYITKRLTHDTEYLGEWMSPYDIEDMNKEFPNIKKHLDSAIAKTDGLVQPTILYHSGRIDPTLVPGSHGIWKTYTSATFQEGTMKNYNRDNPSDWEIVIYAPQGTKGVCGNGSWYHNGKSIGQMNQYTWEHEYLLGRNTGYTVVSMDYENHRQVVILDEP